MSGKPTYEALERRVRELEAENERLRGMEKRWTEDEALHRLITENVTDVIWTRDMDLNLTYLSPSIERMRGYTVEEIMEQSIEESMTPDSAALARRVLTEELVLEQQGGADPERTRTMELEMRCRDGATVWTEITIGFMRDDAGRAVGLIGVTRDISIRKRVEDARKQSELKFRSVFDFSPQPISLTAVESGRILDVNDRFCAITGFSREELLGQTTTELGFYARGDRDRFLDVLARDGEVHELELDLRIRDGTVLSGLIYAKPLRIGAHTFLLTLFVDITERKQLEARLQQSQKMEAIGTLAGGIAHDFNNILSIIVGNTEMAMKDVPEWSQTRFYLEESRTACLRARDLVRQILAFSRRTEKERKPVRIGPIVRDSMRLMRSTLPATISIRQSLDVPADTILADPTQIHQVLLNLCSNAAHAMREKGEVLEIRLENRVLGPEEATEFETLGPGDYLVLTVADTGHGIEPEILERIFDPYFTTKRFGEGSGMGLAVVHGIVRENEGEIQVESESGQGATFRLFFPLLAVPAQEEPEAHRPLPTGTEHVLLVDDEIKIVELCTRMLEHLGYRVTAKQDPREALAAFREDAEGFDLVITDMTMPNQTGADLAREILRIRPGTPILLCTGYSERVTEQEARDQGIRAFVMKPVVLRELAETVRTVLDRPDRGDGPPP